MRLWRVWCKKEHVFKNICNDRPTVSNFIYARVIQANTRVLDFFSRSHLAAFNRFQSSTNNAFLASRTVCKHSNWSPVQYTHISSPPPLSLPLFLSFSHTLRLEKVKNKLIIINTKKNVDATVKQLWVWLKPQSLLRFAIDHSAGWNAQNET